MAVPPILTITLNPALDITTTLPKLLPRQKLRCGPPRYDPGGGGINVSRAIRELGGESRAFVAVGGANGQHYRRLLDETGLETEIWPLEGETRICLAVMEAASGQQYRFMLPGPELDAAAGDALLEGLLKTLGRGERFVVASGRVLPGLPDDFFGKLAARARELGVAMILDTSGPALKGALAFRPYLIRIDHFEAAELVGATNGNRAAAPAVAREIVDRGGAEIVIVTVGEEGAIVATADQLFHITPPTVEMVSGVGAGDSFTGALALGLARGWSLETATRLGVAAAASAVTTTATELCKHEQTMAFFDRIAANVEMLPEPPLPATGSAQSAFSPFRSP